MNTLPDSVASHQSRLANSGKIPGKFRRVFSRLAGSFQHPTPTSGLTPQPPFAKGDHRTWLERLLDEPGLNMSAVKVWRWLNGYGLKRTGGDRGPRRCGSWARLKTMANECGISEAAVRTVALPWLIAHGWVASEELEIDGEVRTFWWCLWLIPRAGGEVDLGHGVTVDGDGRSHYDRDYSGPPMPGPAPKPRKPRAGRPAAAPPISDGRAVDGALSAAPNSSNVIPDLNTLTLARLRPGAEEPKSPESEPPRPPAEHAQAAAEIVRQDPPAPPVPDEPPSVETCLVYLGLPGVRKDPNRAAPWIWGLIDRGEADLARERWKGEFPPRPEPEGPVTPPPRPAAAATSRFAATIGRPEVEGLIRRIAEACGPEARQAKVDALADRLAEALEDPGWRNCFRKRLGLTADGRLPIKAAIAAWKSARNSSSDTKGRIFVDAHNKALGHPGGPIEGFLR